jgi:hypothetical protein
MKKKNPSRLSLPSPAGRFNVSGPTWCLNTSPALNTRPLRESNRMSADNVYQNRTRASKPGQTPNKLRRFPIESKRVFIATRFHPETEKNRGRLKSACCPSAMSVDAMDGIGTARVTPRAGRARLTNSVVEGMTAQTSWHCLAGNQRRHRAGF